MLTREAHKFQGACAARRRGGPPKLDGASSPKPRHPAHIPRHGVPASPDPDAPLLTRRVGVASHRHAARSHHPYRHEENEMTAYTRQRTDHTGTRRFSEGIEQLPDTREKRALGRFSRGIEHHVQRPR
jgi:hypothetical protein